MFRDRGNRLKSTFLVGNTRRTIVCINDAAPYEAVAGKDILHHDIVLMSVCPEIVDPAPAPRYACIGNTFHKTG